jgi:hypothetical protein
MPGELVSDQLSAVLVGEAAHPLVVKFQKNYSLDIYDLRDLMASVKAVIARRW